MLSVNLQIHGFCTLWRCDCPVEDSKVGGLGNLRREMLACFRNRLKDVTASASYLSHYLFNPKTPASLVQKLPLLNAVIEGLQEVKGKRITVLDLRHIPHAVAGWFVIAHGTSRTQVEALAQSVESTSADKAAEKPWGKQGLRNGEWAVLDYSDVVVHVFHEETRDRYALEELWGDANIETVDEV